MRRHAVVLAGAFALALAGCSKACGSDHPYVPYAIGDGASTPAAADDGGVRAAAPGVDDAVPDGGPFSELPAETASVGATTWTVGGVALAAPPGRVFVLALVRDFDRDGAKDAFAIVRPDAPDAPGELYYYRGRPGDAGAAPEPIPAPASLASDTAAVRADAGACAATQRLAQIGRRSIVAEVGIGCPRANAPSRWVMAVAVDDGGALRVDLGATVLDPRGAPKLTVDFDGSDYDGDGADDLALRATLEGGSAPFDPGPKVSAEVRWLDKAAGLSRDPRATEASFEKLAASAAARAGKPRDAAQVPPYVTQVRALYRAMCPEAGAPRIVRRAGSAAMACVQSRALEDASFAEVHAWATLDDPLRAAEALERAQRPPATKTASRLSQAQDWITQAAPVALAREIRYVASVPSLDKGSAPAWGPLAFEPLGKLLVRTAAGVRRVDPALGDENDADAVTVWPSAVASPDGAMQWIEAYDPCDGFALRATIAPTGDGDMHDVPLPVPPPLGGRCSGRGERARVLPIAWGAQGIEAIVAGVPVLVAPDLSHARPLTGALEQPVTPGSPRSPSGKVFVVPTSLGLLVRVVGHPSRLFRSSELDGTYDKQRGCTVNDEATRVACVHSGKAWVGTWDPP
jgi:hypothetical protein